MTAMATLSGCGAGTSATASSSEPPVAAREGGVVAPTFAGSTQQLRSGWNAVGLRGLPVTSLSNANVAGFAYWDGSNYQTSSLDLAALNDNGGTRRGLWVFATAPGNITYTANDPTDVTTTMHAGWNLLAFPALAPVPGSSLVTRENGQVVPIGNVLLTQFYEINADNTYTVVDVSNGGQVSPGQAYWVFASRAVSLSYGSSGTLASVNFGFPEISSLYGISNDGRYLAGTGRLQVEPNRDHGIQADLETRTFVDNPFRDGVPANSGGGAGPMSADGNIQLLRGQDLSSGTPFLAVYTRSSNSNVFQSSGPIGNTAISAPGHFLAWTGAAGQFTDVFTKAVGGAQAVGLKERVPQLDVADRNYGLLSLSDDAHVVLFSDSGQISGQRRVRTVDITTNQVTDVLPNNDFPRFLLSGDARYVLFDNGQQTFVRNITGQSNTLVSDAPSVSVGISSNGECALFTSTASNLVPNDTNNSNDAFLRDLLRGTTVRVSVDSNGNQLPAGVGNSPQIKLSRNGQWVVFKDPGTGSMLRVRNPAL